MRHRAIALLAVAAIAAAACTDDESTAGDDVDQTVGSIDEPATASAATSATALPADTDESVTSIPDGRYERVATMADAEALGIDGDLAAAMLGSDGELPIALVFAGGKWTHLVTNDAGIEEIGDLGTYTYDDEGRWVAVSESPAVRGVALTFQWSFADGALTLTLVPTDETPLDELKDVRLLTEGTFQARLDDSGSDTGDQAGDVTTIAFANALDDLPPEIVAFAVELKRASNGTIELDFQSDYGIRPDGTTGSESDLVDDVASGAVDMAWVGARSLTAFDGLQAPMLVDSYELQEAVFAAGVPTRMLSELDEPGLVGIAALPGPMRKIMGVEKPLLALSDFEGQVVATSTNPLYEATIRALGATPVSAAGGMSLDGIDALESQLAAIGGNGYHTLADSVTANLNLGPRALVVIMNQDAFEALAPEQQQALMAAGLQAVAPAAIEAQREDTFVGPLLCDSEMAVLQTSDANLDGILASLAPVYAELERNPRTAAHLDEIEELKVALNAPPATLVCE